MRLFLLLPLLLGFSIPVIAHNEFNVGEYGYWGATSHSTFNEVNGGESGFPTSCPGFNEDCFKSE